MHVVVDAVAVRTGSSAIVVEHLVRGWRDLAPSDRITVIAGPDGPPFATPSDVNVVAVRPPLGGPAGGAWLRTWEIRRQARVLAADVVLSGVPASGLLGTRCPRGVIIYDLRHELRPHQFPTRTRVARRLSWTQSMRRADCLFTISERTLDDLRRLHPPFAGKAMAAALGSDHVLDWPAPQRGEPPYALAFGHFSNKNANSVIAGWADFCVDDDRWRLRLVGMSTADRAAAHAQVIRHGIGERVELMPWLDDAAFQKLFVGAGLVIFPSDFEGFGLPAAEALRLGIPTVVSNDPALAEVTGGHAVTAASTKATDLSTAYRRALALTPEQLATGRRFAEAFTWRRTAQTMRDSLGR